MRRKFGTFTGGIELADEKQATLASEIAACPPLPRLCVPLSWGSGAPPAEPSVAIGQRVTRGQTLAENRGQAPFPNDEKGASPYFPPCPPFSAPLDGTVSRFCTAEVAEGNDFVTVPAIELTDLSAPELPPDAKPSWDWQNADAATLRARIATAALTAPQKGGPLLSDWIEQARAKSCRTLIANATECQPYVAAEHRLLVEYPQEVLLGLVLLAAAMEIDDVKLAVDHRRTRAYGEVEGPCRLHRIEPVAMLHKYPTGLEPILVRILVRKTVPMDGSALDVGAAVVTPALCWAAYRAVACDAPAMGRAVTVVSEGAGRCGNWFVPFGACCSDLAGASGGVVIHGGPLTGLACPVDAVVGPATDAVLALPAPSERAGPCIRCGWCGDHCPARLNVAALNDMYELGQISAASRAGTLACVECGVCSYICPARLPLTQRVKQLKAAIRWRAKEGA